MPTLPPLGPTTNYLPISGDRLTTDHPYPQRSSISTISTISSSMALLLHLLQQPTDRPIPGAIATTKSPAAADTTPARSARPIPANTPARSTNDRPTPRRPTTNDPTIPSPKVIEERAYGPEEEEGNGYVGGVLYASEHRGFGMNSIIVIATTVQTPQMRYTQDNQTAIAEMIVQFPGTRDNEPPSQLKVTGWGNTALWLHEQCQVGDQHLLEGRLQVNLVQRESFKEKVAELRLSHFGPGAGTLNAVHMVGRAGRDPEVKYFESGGVVCKFTLAVIRRDRNSEPDWFDIEVWDRTAQVAADYVRKGSLVGIAGTLKFDRWDDRNTGTPRSKPVVFVNQLHLLGGKRDQEV